MLRAYAQRFGLRILVETGTYYGEMVEAMKGHFKRIYSIELSPELHALASPRFRGNDSIDLIWGDSAFRIAEPIPVLRDPALFRLDGHYSGPGTARAQSDTPIWQEVGAILSAEEQGHAILIDDARHFGTIAGYPSVAEVRDFARATGRQASLLTDLDCICISPGPRPLATRDG